MTVKIIKPDKSELEAAANASAGSPIDWIDKLFDEGHILITLKEANVSAFRRAFSKAKFKYERALGEDADGRRMTSRVVGRVKIGGISYVQLMYSLAGSTLDKRIQEDFGVVSVTSAYKRKLTPNNEEQQGE